MIKQCFVQGDVENNNVYMTSGFQPPTSTPLHKRIEISSYMQGYASGGSCEHIVLDSKVNNNMKKKIIDRVLKTHVNYMTLSPVVSVCQACGKKHVGEKYVCDGCGSKSITVYARVIGYVRPIVHGNIKVEDGMISGDENYWQNARRTDWVERSKESIETHSYQ